MNKKNILRGLQLLLFPLLLSSCAALGMSGQLKAISKIHQGQTQQQVLSAMKGEPKYRRFMENGIEQWEYHKNVNLSGDYDVVLIGFRDGRVVSLDSFPYVYPKAPESSQPAGPQR